MNSIKLITVLFSIMLIALNGNADDSANKKIPGYDHGSRKLLRIAPAFLHDVQKQCGDQSPPNGRDQKAQTVFAPGVFREEHTQGRASERHEWQ